MSGDNPLCAELWANDFSMGKGSLSIDGLINCDFPKDRGFVFFLLNLYPSTSNL
jgi:hypothetical protein